MLNCTCSPSCLEAAEVLCLVAVALKPLLSPCILFFSQANYSLPVERSRWARGWRWTENIISKLNPGSYRYVCPVKIASSHILSHPATSPQTPICCLNLFGHRFTVLKCRLISQRSTWPCAAVRQTTTLRCMGTGVYNVAMIDSHFGCDSVELRTGLCKCAVYHVICVKYSVCRSVQISFSYRKGCWTLLNVRIMAAEDRIATVGMTTQQQDTHSSTKFVWTWAPWG